MAHCSIEAEKQKALEYLLQQAHSPELKNIPVEVNTCWGPIAPSLFEAIKHFGCDLIILGQKKQNGPLHMFPGSATDHIVTHSPVPVLLIHEDDPLPIFSCNPENQSIRLLIGIDQVQQSTSVLNAAASLFDCLLPSVQTSIHLIRIAIPSLLHDEQNYQQCMQETIDILLEHEHNQAQTHKSDRTLSPDDQVSHVKMKWSMVIEADCVKALINETENVTHAEDTDTAGIYHVIALSTHFGQPSATQQPILSSIIERLIRETQLPVLIVPPMDKPEVSHRTPSLANMYL
jgi:nucleotide-binding universal stress UspA family protein